MLFVSEKEKGKEVEKEVEKEKEKEKMRMSKLERSGRATFGIKKCFYFFNSLSLSLSLCLSFFIFSSFLLPSSFLSDYSFPLSNSLFEEMDGKDEDSEWILKESEPESEVGKKLDRKRGKKLKRKKLKRKRSKKKMLLLFDDVAKRKEGTRKVNLNL